MTEERLALETETVAQRNVLDKLGVCFAIHESEVYFISVNKISNVLFMSVIIKWC